MSSRMATRPPETIPGLASHRLEQELSVRLRRVAGQVKGIQGMLEEGRDPSDIHTQLLAVQSAARAAAELIEHERVVQRVKASIRDALESCVGHCDLCEQLEGLNAAIDELDFSSLERYARSNPRTSADHEVHQSAEQRR